MTSGKLTAFSSNVCVAAGSAAEVVTALKPRFDRDPGEIVLIFEDATGAPVDFNLSGTLEQALARLKPVQTEEEAIRRGPGRPRLGVISREVSLLPRHWEWLEQHPNGASAALRRLVDDDRRHNEDAVHARKTRAAMGRFLTAMAGNLPGYEEASRALFAADRVSFERRIADWPPGIRHYLEAHLGEAFWTAQ